MSKAQPDPSSKHEATPSGLPLGVQWSGEGGGERGECLTAGTVGGWRRHVHSPSSFRAVDTRAGEGVVCGSPLPRKGAALLRRQGDAIQRLAEDLSVLHREARPSARPIALGGRERWHRCQPVTGQAATPRLRAAEDPRAGACSRWSGH